MLSVNSVVSDMLSCDTQAAGVRLPVDERVRQYVRQQVADGIYNVAEVRRHTESFVKRQLFDGKPRPSKLNRRYFPHRRDYENIIYRARVETLRSLVDQENLQIRVTEWQAEAEADSTFFFRPYVEPDSDCGDVPRETDADDNVTLRSDVGGGLLFVHQTEWQRRLLRRYGSLCLLDATYRTTRFALPLFFLCVRTNVDYIVVASFVTQNENSGSVAEALQLIQSWTSNWTPTSFMVDMCEAEINAIHAVFPRKHLLNVVYNNTEKFYDMVVCVRGCDCYCKMLKHHCQPMLYVLKLLRAAVTVWC